MLQMLQNFFARNISLKDERSSTLVEVFDYDNFVLAKRGLKPTIIKLYDDETVARDIARDIARNKKSASWSYKVLRVFHDEMTNRNFYSTNQICKQTLSNIFDEIGWVVVQADSNYLERIAKSCHGNRREDFFHGSHV